MEKLVKQLSEIKIVPVVKIDNADDAIPLAKALKEGGLPCAEITFRTDAAEEAIRRIHNEFPEFLIGAGTVLSPEQADAAINAGATFIVSPGLNPTVVKHCTDKGYAIVPGVCTPTEIELGMSLGLSYLKFFPAEAAGGIKAIKAMSAPYSKIKFMPTGGIGVNNIHDYLSCKAVFACGGSWMVPSDLINAGDFDKICALTKEAVSLAKEI
ncbi:MAG: bifunctional 4-hydroxy-2-oxoglutarate aldolase/2-dehydro-3-deoxy-phosphogluconate aldolase [Clostridia bacterium]|nr:bifunctional 4-hydroxy-2-oxoglutarate aldolase/2-dehydro-3-deoxy-phosphogluconate aldolase [Clostridia bacterium]MBQ6613799.1 bifunctional 4-hydroxy-2-oxoglutarate aldolase/2-dehydro-3-deoxy-phosphogluconate aldolase [Clostridia bacterium]